MDDVERVAEAVLYEGYLLYPYTRSALKNQQRWTFGGVYPRQYSEATGGHDPWFMQTECLLQGDDETEVEVLVRFLQIVRRTVFRCDGGALSPVDELRVGEQVYRPWEESRERSIVPGGGELRLGDLRRQARSDPIAFGAGTEHERLVDAAGLEVGSLAREWAALQGTIDVRAAVVTGNCVRLTVCIANTTQLSNVSQGWRRNEALVQTMISTHTILRVRRGEFISLLEPPAAYAEEAARCENVKTWPVLAGARGQRQTVLSSPIILYDYPAVSPESRGNFYDATEIDELLTLGVMTLTDAEKQSMRETDPRSREILERTESVTLDQLMGLHAMVRTVPPEREEGS